MGEISRLNLNTEIKQRDQHIVTNTLPKFYPQYDEMRNSHVFLSEYLEFAEKILFNSQSSNFTSNKIRK